MENIRREGQSFTPPWSRTESLLELSEEAGVDYDEFIACLYRDESIEEMAKKFDVKNETIECLQEYFYRNGLSTVIGGD